MDFVGGKLNAHDALVDSETLLIVSSKLMVETGMSHGYFIASQASENENKIHRKVHAQQNLQ